MLRSTPGEPPLVSQNPPRKNESSQSSPQQESNGSAFAVTSPSIELPKDGSAIKGILEKFAANPVTGNGSVTILLLVSPGLPGLGWFLSVICFNGNIATKLSQRHSHATSACLTRTGMDKRIVQYYSIHIPAEQVNTTITVPLYIQVFTGNGFSSTALRWNRA